MENLIQRVREIAMQFNNNNCKKVFEDPETMWLKDN